MDTISLDKFHFFDSRQEYSVTYGDLPHWEQPGVTYFVTFRTADSLPREVYRRWLRERDDWLTRRTEIDDGSAWYEKLQALSATQRHEFSRAFRHKLEQQLDRSFGSCPFGSEQYSEVVVSALQHFDGQRYHLGDFVVMPNHVHLLVCMFKNWRLSRQCYSWKHYIAGQVNARRGTSGTLFQSESFDHLVRDGDHLEKFCRYIAKNPRLARLSSGSYQLVGCGPGTP